jgi:hypothetical protein
MTTNFNQPTGGMPQPIPNATGVLVLGIVSIVLCWCGGIVGLIAGIIALVLHSKGVSTYNANPSSYTSGSLQNMNAGRICAIIGIILSFLYLIYMVFLVAQYGLNFNRYY